VIDGDALSMWWLFLETALSTYAVVAMPFPLISFHAFLSSLRQCNTKLKAIAVVQTVKWAELCTLQSHYQQLKSRQTVKTMSRIRAIMMPKAMSFIFMFSHHIFCRIFVPCFLKSCAWRQVWTGRCLSRTEDSD
jgi:hypothetical protein